MKTAMLTVIVFIVFIIVILYVYKYYTPKTKAGMRIKKFVRNYVHRHIGVV